MPDLPPEFIRPVQFCRENYSKENTDGLNDREPLPGGETITRRK